MDADALSTAALLDMAAVLWTWAVIGFAGWFLATIAVTGIKR